MSSHPPLRKQKNTAEWLAQITRAAETTIEEIHEYERTRAAREAALIRKTEEDFRTEFAWFYEQKAEPV